MNLSTHARAQALRGRDGRAFRSRLRRKREPRVSNKANIMTNSEIVETGKAGRVSKYSPIVADRLLASLAAGLTQKQACMATGICKSTLSTWRKQHPELEPQMGAKAQHAMVVVTEAKRATPAASPASFANVHITLSLPCGEQKRHNPHCVKYWE